VIKSGIINVPYKNQHFIPKKKRIITSACSYRFFNTGTEIAGQGRAGQTRQDRQSDKADQNIISTFLCIKSEDDHYLCLFLQLFQHWASILLQFVFPWRSPGPFRLGHHSWGPFRLLVTGAPLDGLCLAG